MIIVGVTGGIGSGKSEVSRILGDLGAVVIDADQVAREVVEPGTPGLAAVVEAFGTEVLGPDGRLDRPKLGRVVFGNPELLARLNGILHPLIGARFRERCDEAPPDSVIVHDVPLLTENGMRAGYHTVIVVDTSPETQIERLVRYRGMPEEDARARMAAQATREQRLAVADVVIDNDGPLERLRPQVEKVWRRLREHAGADAG